MKVRLLTAGVFAALFILTGCVQHQPQPEELPILNYTAPAAGDTIVRIRIRDYGDVKLRLFPEQLPQACEQFTALAEQGAYDGLTFDRVIRNFAIESEAPDGKTFQGRCCRQLIHLPGAVAFTNTGENSRFYIVTGKSVTEENLRNYASYPPLWYTAEAAALYTQYGGTPWLDGCDTVFGQVIDGLDVVYAISKTPVDQENNKPKTAVYIEKVTVEQYDGSEIRWYPADYGL